MKDKDKMLNVTKAQRR